MDRNQHLKWCKDRALEYVIVGDNEQAIASMASDLGKHPDILSAVEICLGFGMELLTSGKLNSTEKMRIFINGFN
jgi:hypothetical protein